MTSAGAAGDTLEEINLELFPKIEGMEIGRRKGGTRREKKEREREKGKGNFHPIASALHLA
jgi:hypothetical protein